jgi:hypothetical protein
VFLVTCRAFGPAEAAQKKTAKDELKTFRDKRDEIVNHHCP